MSETLPPSGYIDPRVRRGRFFGTLLNIVVLLLLVSISLSLIEQEGNTSIFLGLGVVGVWRHGWGILNVFRASAYIRKNRNSATGRQPISNTLTVVVTFYNQTDEEVALVAKELTHATETLSQKPLYVIAYKTEDQRRLIDDIVQRHAAVHYVKQQGLGKREALADALWLARSVLPGEALEHGYVLLMDGDTLATRDAVLRSLETLASKPTIGAVVVNEIPFVKGSQLFGVWRLLRSIQRNKLMSAFALSERVLVLTGRFAMLRANIILQRDVINRIRKDYVETSNAYVPLLSGDDKTTWLEVLRRNYGMIYLPKTFIYPIENPNLESGFLKGVYALTFRYAGNMARANLHPDAWSKAKGKWHFYYGLLDQRVSMWTSLLTPFALLMLLVFGPFSLFVIFLTYVLMIKNMQASVAALLGGHYDPWFPYLMLFDQTMQSIVKIMAFAYPHRQSWSNQGISLSIGTDAAALDANSKRVLKLRLMFFGIALCYTFVLLA